MHKNIILEQMGITQWQLREPSGQSIRAANETLKIPTPSPQNSESTPQHREQRESAIELDENPGQTIEKTSTDASTKIRPTDWPALLERLNNKQHCQSCAKVTPIIGDGDISADWMFVFDSPTMRDIQQQELLTGRVGQLFDAMLVALNLNRQSIYLSSIFKCPPAANISENAALCDGLLGEQIKLVQPKVVIAFGEFTAQALIKANEDLDQLRLQTQRIYNQSIKVVPTYSLAQMLDTPLLKSEVWNDLKAARLLIEN
ncbi:uracil-DNA glycosylase [Arenicella sp.]|nr:uracil-DNA glycosylase [Arenicella sp.]